MNPVVGSSGSTVAVPSALLVRVPMPNTSDPDTVVVPALPTAGRSMITPLLSVPNRITGFGSCCMTLAVASAHVLGVGQL